MRQVPPHYIPLFSRFSESLGELLVTEKNSISQSADYILVGDLSFALRYLADGTVSTPKTAGLPRCDSNDNAMTIIQSSLPVLYLMFRTLNDDSSESHNPALASEIKSLYDQLSSPFIGQSSTTVVAPSSLFSSTQNVQSSPAAIQPAPSNNSLDGKAWLSLTGNQELCLSYSSSAQRDDAYQALIRSSGEQAIDSVYRSGQAFFRNPSGRTPITYDECPYDIYFPTYSADSSVIACNFVCPMIRSSFLATLGVIGYREDDLFNPQLFSQAYQTFYDSQGNELAHTRAIGSSGDPNTCALFFKSGIFNQSIEIDMRYPPAGFFSQTTIQAQHHYRVAP